jgi:hypothetical protein
MYTRKEQPDRFDRGLSAISRILWLHLFKKIQRLFDMTFLKF